MDHIKAVILTMTEAEANIIAVTQLRRKGYTGVIGAITQYAEEASNIIEAGADMTFTPFEEIGVGLAEHVWEKLYDTAPS
jgi:voltage-gated potassium channel Kch